MSQRVFISYSRNDAAFASRLAADLRQHGADVWIDTDAIHAGVKWSTAIQEGLDAAQIMILIHSPTAAASENVEEEWQYFRDNKKPIIPILWLPAKIHFQISRLQWVDFHALAYEAAFEKLRAELALRGITLNAAPVVTAPPVQSPQPKPVGTRPTASAAPHTPARPKFIIPNYIIAEGAGAARPAPAKPKFTLPLLEWINISTGQVTLEKGKEVYGSNYSEEPLGTYLVAPFAIAKYPVTNEQFEAFINDGGYQDTRYWQGVPHETAPITPWRNEPTCPRESVNWCEAIAFTRWLSEKTGLIVTLPTDMQWQWAAEGDKSWVYPYGNIFDKMKSNTKESGIKRTTPVDHYPQGASPFGVMDMSGNVREWCLNEHGNPSPDIASSRWRGLRGGSFNDKQSEARSAFCTLTSLFTRYNYIGFRVVISGPG